MQIQRIRWERVFASPYISPIENTVAPAAVTTPDYLNFDGEKVFYIGGVSAGKERIIRLPLSDPDIEKLPASSLSSASVVLDAGLHDYDCYHVYDPATLVLNKKIYMFYSAIGKGPDSIGLAVSNNGKEFTKLDYPVLPGRSPEVVWHDGRCYLFYVLTSEEPVYQIYASTSEDFNTFRALSAEPVLKKGSPGTWDQYEVTTPRIFNRGGTYYMIYGGSSSTIRKDMPDAFGLARSTDLTHWEKYPYNPIFNIGATESWDSGAIWFGTVFEENGYLYLLYEGGRLIDIQNLSPAITQVGLARIACADFDRSIAGW